MPIKTLPAMEHVFTVELKGSGTGQAYAGTFKYKRPTIRIKSDIAKTKAILDGGLELDSDMDFIHNVLASLRHTLVEYPEWWTDKDFGFEIDESDLNVVLDIYKECNEFEKQWFDKVWSDKPSETKESEPKNAEEPKSKK